MLQLPAQGGGPASGDGPPPPSADGQCDTPSADGTFWRETQSDEAQGDFLVSTLRSSSQPGTLGAPDARWNATLDGDLQGVVGSDGGQRELAPGSGTREQGPPIREANDGAPQARRDNDEINLDQLPVVLGAQINGASDAQVDGASDAHERRNGASDAHVNCSSDRDHTTPNGASDAHSHGASDAQAINAQPPETFPSNDTHHGASVAQESTCEGNTIPPATQHLGGIQVGPTGHADTVGIGDASRRPLQGQRGRRVRSGHGSRRRILPPQIPRNDPVRTLIDTIIGSLPYLSTLNNRQIGTHTWSNQLVPLIWCATQDDSYELLREALITAERGHSALTAFRAWWSGQGIHTAENARHTLDAISRQIGGGGPLSRQYQYLQAPVQEHIAALSGANLLVASDLVRVLPTREGSGIGDPAPHHRGRDTGTADEGDSAATDTREPTPPHASVHSEHDSSRTIERLICAIEQFRAEAPRRAERGDTINAAAITRIQEAIVWLTCSRGGAEQATQALTTNNVGIRASTAMYEWWERQGVQSPTQAFNYIRGINQSAHPDEVYGALSIQVVEDLIQAAAASDLVMQDLTIEQSPCEEIRREYDEDLGHRVGGELLNRRHWNDTEGWVASATWLALPAYHTSTLVPILQEMGIECRPFDRLNAWFATQGIRNPREMDARLDRQDISARGNDTEEEDERNARIMSMLAETGLDVELRRAAEAGLSGRRTAVDPPIADGETCVICWEGNDEGATDALSRWPQCGHVIHEDCLNRWIGQCHGNMNTPRCPICRRNMQGQPERHDTRMEDEHQAPRRQNTHLETEPQDYDETGTQTTNATHGSGTERQAPGHQHDVNGGRRGTSSLPNMSRWAGILASSSAAQWHGKTEQIPPELVHALVQDLCPAALISGRQHMLAGDSFGSRLGIECYPGDRDGITAAVSRARVNARRQGDDLPTVLVSEVGGSQVQQTVRQARAAGCHMQLYVLAAGQVASAQATGTNEIVRIAHKAWGHRAIASMSSISAVGWPWCVDGNGSRFAQIIIASILIAPNPTRTTEAPLIRIVGLPSMEDTRGISITATGRVEEEVTAALVRAQTTATSDNLSFRWDTSHIRRQRGTNRSQPGAAQMAIHTVEVSTQRGGADGVDRCNRVIGALQDALMTAHNGVTYNQAGNAGGRIPCIGHNAGEWCIAWSQEEMDHAIHVPMPRHLAYTALLGIQPIAMRFGAKAVPVETGVAIIGCAPAVAEAVLQGCAQQETGIHVPRRILTYPTHREHEVDIRLSSPSAGHDLTWMIATGGQVHPSTVANALRDVLGEYPTAEAVCGLNPHTREFEQMIQVTVPAHLRQRMLMGPGAEGRIFVEGRSHRVYPFTEVRQQGRHRAGDDTRAAGLLGEALRSNPTSHRSTVFAQVATMHISADEHESARSVPVMIPLGKGLWNNIRQGQGYTPAAYTMPTLGTNLALALWTDATGEGQGAIHGITRETARQVHNAAHREPALAAENEEAIQVHSRHDHGGGNVAIALGPGDMIATAVSAGGTINIRNACENIHLHLTQHAWSVIRHPAQANLQAARHSIDATVQVELELVAGTVWHYQKRRHPASNSQDTIPPNGDGNHNATAADEDRDRDTTTEGNGARTSPCAETGTFGGSLQHMRHVQWESAHTVAEAGPNPLVADLALEAAGETLSSFGTGAPREMTHAFATWLIRHIKRRRETRAPNHWCWSITTVCWLISRAMQQRDAEPSLHVRLLATHFGMNAAGMRQNPIAAWIQTDAGCDYAFAPGTLPPGAQSLGAHESVVSHTNPRVSHAAGIALDRLVQLIWEERNLGGPCQRDGDESSHPHDSDMQVDSDEDRRDADMGTGDTSAGYEPLRQAGANNTAAEQCDNCAETARTPDSDETQVSCTRDNEESQGVNPCVEGHSRDVGHTETTPRGQNPTDGNDNGDPFASRPISPTAPFTPTECRPHSDETADSSAGERLQAGPGTGNEGRTHTDNGGVDLGRVERVGHGSNNDDAHQDGVMQASQRDPRTPETCGDTSGDATNQAADNTTDDRGTQAAGEPGDSAGNDETVNHTNDDEARSTGRASEHAAHNPPIHDLRCAFEWQSRGTDTANREIAPVSIPTATPADATGATGACGAATTGHTNRSPDGNTSRATAGRFARDEPRETTGNGHTTSGSTDDTSHPTRRPLSGEREESTMRRARTSSPTRNGEAPATLAGDWGLGTCNAEGRWNRCDQYIREHGTNATRQGVIQSLRNGGCTGQIAESTVQSWLQAGLLLLDGEFVRPGNTDSQANWIPLQPLTGQEPCDRGTTCVALLSLFDGTGLARIAMGEAIQECEGITLVRSAFVEHDRTLASRVANVWSNEVTSGHTQVAHTPIASDIWDLFRPENRPLGTLTSVALLPPDQNTPLSRFAQSLPTGCITFIVAGSPCQQLTYAGRYRGMQGLCGPDSVLFFAVPTVAWALQKLRPDTNVHVVLENAGSMQSRHKAAIMQALGGLNAGEHLRTLDSREWSAFPRRRHYFMTLPDSGPLALPARRDTPWESGWGPIPSANIYPMMCSRNNVTPRASTIQYHAHALLYRYATGDHDFDWHGRPEQHARNEIIRSMPSDIGDLYKILLGGTMTYDVERRMGPVMDWIHNEGPRCGYRVPNPNERARATGRAHYFAALGLTEVQLYNAVGNHFDPDALRARIRGPLSRIGRNAQTLRHQYPTPADLSVIYQEVAREVAGQHIPTAPAPFPLDLVQVLTATCSTGHAPPLASSGSGGAEIAAEHGRRAQ